MNTTHIAKILTQLSKDGREIPHDHLAIKKYGCFAIRNDGAKTPIAVWKKMPHELKAVWNIHKNTAGEVHVLETMWGFNLIGRNGSFDIETAPMVPTERPARRASGW